MEKVVDDRIYTFNSKKRSKIQKCFTVLNFLHKIRKKTSLLESCL